MALRSPFKGPRKAKRLPLVVATSHLGYRVFDYLLQALFEDADIISEGASKAPRGALDGENAYFGTTNIVLVPNALESLDPQRLVQILSCDPHLRLRALRIACREAQVRANGALDRVRTEIVVTQGDPGIRIHVDLEARVLSEHQSVGTSSRQAVRLGSKPARRVV